MRNDNPSAVNIPKALTVKSKYHFLPKEFLGEMADSQSREEICKMSLEYPVTPEDKEVIKESQVILNGNQSQHEGTSIGKR